MAKETLIANQPVAVIDIGTSALRMLIAQVGPKTEIQYLENLQKPVRLGRDVFTTGRISSAGLRESLSILKNYKTLLEGYGVKKVQAIATSAVREAVNRENFIDQVYVRTGIDVEILDGAEENRLELLAVEHAIGADIALDTHNCLIVEVGTGSTEIIILNQGQVEVTRTLSFGSVRLPGNATSEETRGANLQKLLKKNIHDIVVHAATEYKMADVDLVIALGGDMRFAAQQLCDKVEGRFSVIEGKAFTIFVNKISKMTPEDLVKQYGMPYDDAQMLQPALMVYSNFLNETSSEKIIVPITSIRDGLLLEYAQIQSGYKRTDVGKQVINSARHLGHKYQYDKAHASVVASLAVKFFDLLKNEHGMGTRERLLLEVSSVLHDIGTYISPASHHKHSSYLVNAAEIFGLRKGDKEVVSNVVRYHRKSVPRQTHEPYMSQPRNERAVVSKLAAILRVADALDSSHQQKIREFTLTSSRENYTIWVSPDIGDISVERASLKLKGEMFGDIFGSTISLKQGAPPS